MPALLIMLICCTKRRRQIDEIAYSVVAFYLVAVLREWNLEMRWKTWKGAAEGDKRKSTWFAFLPISLNGDIRWLEKVTVEWEYSFVANSFPGRARLKWHKIRFVDESVTA